MKDKMQGRMKNGSLTGDIAVIILALVTGTVLLCWLLNTVLLEPYYVVKKQNTLLDSFNTIDAASANGTLSDSSFDVTFETLCANGNITIMIIQSDLTIVRSSVNDTQRMLLEFTGTIFGGRENEVTVLKEADNYEIQRQTDSRLDAEYLVMYGTLTNGNLILMRTALESIRESAKISNQFLGIIGIIALIFSAIASFALSRRVTKPLLELTEISQRMADLDFQAKYTSHNKRKNEIDELGDHMNMLSGTLEQTISELKSANNRLQIDIEKKEQIDRMRREFLGNVSHELKTPLALIQGYAEGLKECVNDDAESRTYYSEVIIDEAGKMNAMVAKLLTLNQLEAGNETVTMEHFDLTELLRGVVHSVEILMEQSGIRVTDFPKEPIYVWADEFLVEEVITNYISNAIHYAADSREIRISYEKKDGCIRVNVYNSGSGIPEEDIDKIWGKFYKVDKARTREYGGSGIGLSIVKAVMESMHRECGVYNTTDGVVFWFELDTASR